MDKINSDVQISKTFLDEIGLLVQIVNYWNLSTTDICETK
jgi:hypothetical protein